MTSRWPVTVRGIGAVLLAVALFVAADQLGLVELVMFGVLLLALLVATAIWVFVSPRRADVVRAFSPETVGAGADVAVAVRVRMLSSPRMPAGTWRDTLPPELGGDASGAFAAVPSGWSQADRTLDLGYRLDADARGVQWIGPLRLTVTDPFGLWRRTVEVGEASRLVVTPAAVDLTPVRFALGATGGAQPTPSNRLGQGSDDLIARPWAPGDSMRRIHWRASAHRDELMVRQEERETSPEATVILDRSVRRFSPEAAERTGSDPAFELAVTALVSAVARLVRDGFTVAVVDAEGRVLCDAVDAGDEPALEEMRTALAEVHADGDADLALLAERFAGEAAGPLVLVTGRLSDADAPALNLLAARSALPILLATGVDGARAPHGWHGGGVRTPEDLRAAWSPAPVEGVRRAAR